MSPTATNRPRRLSDLLDPAFMASLDVLDVMSRKILQGKLQGERRAKRRGRSVEFADHRPYVVGDDLRFVDWNIYGRLDQLFLKLFLEELDLSVQILIDTSGSVAMGEPSKELAIKKLAAALGYVGLVNNNRVTLSAFADGLRGQAANMRGRRYAQRLADFLLGIRAEGLSHFERACAQLAARRAGAGVLIVISDFLFKEGYEAGLRRLTCQQYDLYLIQVLSPQEIEPDLTGDLKLLDIEDGDAAEVTISAALLEYYKRNLAGYCNELKDFCRRRGMTYLLTNSAERMEDFVLKTLRRFGLLK
ncbi:MAG: hypothetical protein B1H04_06820 [Planctomycetales bacterium 4484_123]|nr:MAG: hypothetical protein B1H04_06820 [Planctomycetales bacterium 4484_123]